MCSGVIPIAEETKERLLRALNEIRKVRAVARLRSHLWGPSLVKGRGGSDVRRLHLVNYWRERLAPSIWKPISTPLLHLPDKLRELVLSRQHFKAGLHMIRTSPENEQGLANVMNPASRVKNFTFSESLHHAYLIDNRFLLLLLLSYGFSLWWAYLPLDILVLVLGVLFTNPETPQPGNSMMPHYNDEGTSRQGGELSDAVAPFLKNQPGNGPSIESGGSSTFSNWFGLQTGASSSASAAEAEKVGIPSPEISQGELLGDSPHPHPDDADQDQQIQPEIGMPQDAPGHEILPPEIPQLEPPLITDHERFRELYQRFHMTSISGRTEITDLPDFTGRLERAVMIERMIEAALVFDGYDPNRIRERITKIRELLFNHPTRVLLLSEHTLDRYLNEIQMNGTRQSVPYQRLVNAIRNSNLIL